MVTEGVAKISARRCQATAAAVGASLTYLSIWASQLALLLGNENLHSSLFAVAFWPLIILVPLFGWFGFKSYWIPHPLALALAPALATAVYSLITYFVITLYLKTTR